MRLWSLHPKYLDRMGLLAAWREGLLAQKVLEGGTKGYRNHPQLVRFRAADEPIIAVGAYLSCVAGEAAARGYDFDVGKIDAANAGTETDPTMTDRSAGSESKRRKIPVASGQAAYEWALLKRKLTLRDPEKLSTLCGIENPDLNDAFRLTAGAIEAWEKTIPEVLADLK